MGSFKALNFSVSFIKTQFEISSLPGFQSSPIKDNFTVPFKQFKVVNLILEFEILEITQVEVHACWFIKLPSDHSLLLINLIFELKIINEGLIVYHFIEGSF